MRRSSVAAVLTLVALLVGVLAPAVFANGTAGDFEVDGNRPDSPSGAPLDWSTVPGVKSFTDAKKSRNDDVYKDGSKALEPGGWGCAVKQAPAKDDIVSAAIALRKVSGDKWMYVNWERASTNGTANVDYEFSQSAQDVPGCPGLPLRTEGDIIIAYDFDSSPSIRIFRWHFTGPGVGQYVEDDATLVEHVTYDVAVNSGSGTSNEGKLPAGAFGEASINLTRTIGDICPRFASAYVRTRTSTSISSDPKDRTFKRSDICEAKPTISKTAVGSVVEVGGNVTFNIAYGNDASADTMQSATITDTIPAGTEFVSCSNDCTVNGSTVTWTVGPVEPGQGGTVSLVLRVVQVPSGCMLCNTARIHSAQQASTTPDPTSTACIRVSPGPAPNTARANGSAVGVHIFDTQYANPGFNLPNPPASSSQTGVGEAEDKNSVLNVRTPSNELIPPVLEVDLISGDSKSVVTSNPAMSSQTSIGQIVGLDILNGTITAELVRAVAHAEATPDGARTDTLGTGFVNLRIDTNPLDGQPGQLYDNAAPGAFIDLSALFGKGPNNAKSGVTLRKVTSSTTGTFVADQSVVMIDVTAWDRDNNPVNGRQTTTVQVASATAHAEHPSVDGCPGSVSGHAFIASAKLTPVYPDPLVVVGYASIPQYGGNDHQALNTVMIPADGSVLSAALTSSDSAGTLTATQAVSDDYAELNNVCVLRDAMGPGTGCLVGATLVRSQAHSADGSGAAGSSNDTGTQLVGLTVAGTPINIDYTQRNQVISLGPLGFVVLNEQFCDGGNVVAPGPVPACGGASHTGLTVRAIRVVLLDEPPGDNGLLEVIVAEAHSDATAP